MKSKGIYLIASILALSIIASAQEGAEASQNGSSIILNQSIVGIAIAGIAVVLVIAVICILMLKFQRLILEVREKLTFSASTADNGKASLEAIQKLEGQLNSLHKEIGAIPSRIKQPAPESPAPSADEFANKVTASKAFTDMTTNVNKCCTELNRLCKDVEAKCSETIGNAQTAISQSASDISAFSQRLNSLDESMNSVPTKAHTIVERDLDKAKEFFSDALQRIEKASAAIAGVESQLACLKDVASKANQISTAVERSTMQNETMAAQASLVGKGIADMTEGIAKFKEFSEQIPAAAKAESSLAEAKALLKSKSDELEEVRRREADFAAKAETAESRVKMLEGEKQQLIEKTNELLRTSESIQRRLEETVAASNQRENEFNAMKNQFDGVTRRLEILDGKRKDAENARDALAAQAASIESELKATQKQYDATAQELTRIKPAYDAMMAEKSVLYPDGINAAPYNGALEELERLAHGGSANAELCLRDLAMINTFLKPEGPVSKDSQEQLLRILWYFSRNFTAAMKETGATPEESCNHLNVWLSFFLERKDDGFALQLPDIGDAVTLAWMTPVTPGTNTVSAIESWAVFAGENTTPTYKAFVR